MVDRTVQGARVGNARRIPAKTVAEQREYARLVEGCKSLDPVTVTVCDQRRIIGKPSSDIPVLPAAKLGQRLGQVPMVETDPRLDAGIQQRFNQSIVEIQPGLVGDAAPPR